MQSLTDALLESWDRQARIVDNVANLVTPDLIDAKSREGEFPIGEHLCHIHGVRRYWLRQFDPQAAEGLASLYTENGEEWIPSGDLDQIRTQLKDSAARVRTAVERGLADPKPSGGYDHPVFFLQHMIWHEGWHVGAIIHALRANGHEPQEEWEEPNIWGLWRTE